MRSRVAKEAALLLYTSQENEYKQAKERAARILANRPFKDKDHFINSLDDPEVGEKMLEFLTFRQ